MPWLSSGKILTLLFELRDKLNFFFTDHHFLTQLAYLDDVFSRLNDLNLGLQGLSATIFNVRDTIEAMIKNLERFSGCINKDNTPLSIIV